MKKMKLGLVFVVMGMLFISGCGNTSNKSASSDTKTSSSSQKESSESSTGEKLESSSSESLEKTDESGNSKTFKLMIEGAQSQVPNLKKQYEGMYSDISITEGEDSTIVYTYTFAEQSDAEALKPTLVKGLKPVIDGAKAIIPDVKIRAIFLNPDGSEVLNLLITQEDTDSITTEE
ncbi:hypothetical protein JZO66_08165 [Enterococcus sp. DIV0242_7C1]|uniref:DUF5067 domain-containing protein n=1 Tax=Candidatus Enterococcus dunnyi TaxID=1834192 RepID=A0A200JDZ8_9ENTE|nr:MULTISPECIES: hypothetical protein [unclassified Enterococcus]MBO0470518.1 hypothetical protein [Enterococcus sp. DIV0242_7C1]OUZ34825.1 hypothetical protein A5889_000300 [Enterococcus sp. 9D6_DIV0238]